MKVDNRILIAIIVVLSFVVFKQMRQNKKQQRLFTELVGTETEFKKLKNENALLAIKYKTQVEIAQETLNKFHEVKGELESRIKVLSSATFLIAEKARESGKSDATFVGKNNSYVLNEIRFDNGPAVGYVIILDNGKVTSKIYDHEIVIDQVVSKDEKSGKYKIIAHADYVLKSPALQNTWYKKPYRLKIKNGEASVDPTEPLYVKKSFMWAPRLNMNAVAKPQVIPGLSVSLAGYGVSERDLQYKFLDIGVAYDQKREEFNPTFMPILIRPLPNYLPNTYIGPGIMMNGSYFGGLQVGF